MNNGRKSQYVELDSSHSVSTNMNGQDSGEGMFARGVGFEEPNGADSGARAPRRSMFGTLKNAAGGKSINDGLVAHKEKPRQSMGGTGGEGNMEKGNHEHIEAVEITRKRKLWVYFTWAMTFWMPSGVLSLCGRMKRPDVRMAWREKVAICAIVLFLWFVLLFIIIGLGLILCPKEYVWTMDDVAGINTPKKSYMATRGDVYDITDFIKQTGHGDARNRARPDQLSMFVGYDTNASFPITARAACPDLVSATRDPNYLIQYPISGASSNVDPNAGVYFKHMPQTDPTSKELSSREFYWKYFQPAMEKFKKGGVVWKMDWLNTMYKDQSMQWLVIDKEVFYMQPYIDAIGYAGNNNKTYNFLDSRFEELLNRGGYGTADITEDWRGLSWDAATAQTNYNCMKRLFFVGKVDERQSVRCLFTNYMLVAFACVLMLVVLVKFLTALQFGNKSRPSPPEKFVVCQVPCYTEDEESILKTIESLAGLDYVDKHKLLFIICDGNIVGSGNEKSTPRIVLDTLGVDPDYDPPGRDYLAIAEGSRRHNIGKVYSGLYEFEGHIVPFMVVAKVGTPEEASRSGNRGKRDSQILLMSFFNKVHFNLPMTPLELEIYHQMRHIIGVPPRNYEYLLQVDADTEVMPDSLARLVSACTGDRRIAGICGETMLGNESRSWTTMIQVYEYFISHHMAKAFESLFGSVTCLPGCFSMFRLRTTDGKPLLIAKPIVEAYSELHVDTLHKKNLLSLGEDRYLTTLMMKHFPRFKLKFIQDAKCKTIAPEKWSVLVSQRRRWINSTVHNLAELMFLPNMCGFCCFSMRFVVFLDLFGTLTMPTTLIYFAYLIYAAVRNIADVGYISLILIGAIYGVQAIIFILRREWQHVGWMFIYLLAYPLWSFVLPVYSFWHMDDFSWGNTRVVVGDGKRKIIIEDDKPFDPASIPQRKWMEYEKELAMAGVLNAPPPNMNPNAGSSKEEDRLSMYSSQSGGAHLSRAESAMAFAQMPHPQSMYGGVPSQMGGGFDPRLSMAMTNPQMMAMQQQPPSMYEHPMVRMSTASSGAMTPMMDPRLSTAMYNPHMQSGASSPHSSILQQQQQLQQQQSGYMADTWMPPTMYGTQSQYVPMQEMSSSLSGRTSPAHPSDEQIIDAIRRILVNADLSTTTKKVIRAQLAQEFATDLSDRKEFISKVVDQMLIGGA
ncbi:hypothetical protein IWW55_003239 [Coemansia sp. RSA 2706]|nr:hypothetical protein IWW55_003239 [Coemansia sp. RSA 2706]KAJ2315190.1 hypothetical protein IWW54_000458 [Coemansia sp. RSA 2705]KAJ2321956.1 hypothetical protein IWW52_000398 [Coemansia sp. RSA 2704]KAJ2329860.1 hypothetical protein IWW51_000331 [Coemansia sp. RSA 2702]KAJ2369990.1 hypothetical protein H4S01_000663 [Coemansia sp. RSA 2610]KAJ2393162.1 hypothetical protein H4S02_000381 [Coemansia sp. RSA 2611]